MPSTVLIIEDDPDTVEIVRLYLHRDGYRVLSAADGLKGLEMVRAENPDLVVLDLMLPGMDGLTLCNSLRKESDVPVVMLTARVDEEDRLAGLDMGADDYITKPFSPRELAARVRAVLRRAARDAVESGPSEMAQGDIRVDLRGRSAYVRDALVPLTPTEFRLLALLIKRPGNILTRDQIIDSVFGYDFDGFDRTVDAHISNLRRKLQSSRGTGDKHRYINTVYGVGYTFSPSTA